MEGLAASGGDAVTAQLELGSAPRNCEWCANAPAIKWIVGTFACATCAAATAAERVIAAMRRWGKR